jgi:hypothetical protein
MENDEGRPRHDEVRVHLPRIIGISKTRFVHELDDHDKLNETYRTIRYHGMNSEHKHEESRAIQSDFWTIWNEIKKKFTRPPNFGHGNYVFIKFPREYWDELV